MVCWAPAFVFAWHSKIGPRCFHILAPCQPEAVRELMADPSHGMRAVISSWDPSAERKLCASIAPFRTQPIHGVAIATDPKTWDGNICLQLLFLLSSGSKPRQFPFHTRRSVDTLPTILLFVLVAEEAIPDIVDPLMEGHGYQNSRNQVRTEKKCSYIHQRWYAAVVLDRAYSSVRLLGSEIRSVASPCIIPCT